MQSKWYEKIRNYYISGLWSREQVEAVVGKALTKEEAEEIISARQG